MKKYIKLISLFTVFLVSLFLLFNPLSEPKAVDCSSTNTGGDYTVSTSCAFASDGTTTTVADSSTNASKGTPTGTTIVTGKYGSARSFVGASSDFIDFGLHTIGPILSGATGTTVEYWLKLTSIPTAGNYFQIVAVVNSTGGAIDTKIDENGKASIGGRSISTDTFQGATSNTALETGQWYHIAGVYDYPNDTIKIYINGELDKTQGATFNATSFTDSAHGSLNDLIGNFESTSRYLNGIIDDVRIYDYARSEDQITEDKNNRTASTGNDPVARWKMDDGYTNGVDNGDLTVATGNTLTVNSGQTVVWNPSKGIIIEEGAFIAINTTGQLKQSYLWVADSDTDGWYFDATQVASDTQPTDFVRRYATMGSVFGNGSDGSVTFNTNTNINSTNTISGRSCADGGDAVNYSVSALSTNTATLSTTPSSGCLAVGNDILIINLQGDSTNYGNAGNYELLKVQNVSGNIITFATDIKKIYGATSSNSVLTGQKILFQRVPQYSNATINDGVTVTGNTWDGIKGGVFAMKTSGTVAINTGGYGGGIISMNEKGYRKGTNYGPCTYEYQGESYSRTGVSSNAANLGGGGGGWQENCGGDIWAGGGGGGGYGTSGSTGEWGDSGGVPGTGGGTYGSTNLSDIFLGSGGGAGGSYSQSPYGGNGGGIIIINANTITVSGIISANGQNGLTSTDAGSGGGSGGSVLITSGTPTLGSNLVTAIKGNGGNSTQYVWRGVGGNGGDGRIAIYYGSSLSGTANPAAYSSQVSDAGGNIYLAENNETTPRKFLDTLAHSFKSFLQ